MAMFTINISSLKNQLSAVLKKVRRGEEVLVIDRNQPVARLSAYSLAASSQPSSAMIETLEKNGMVTAALKKMPSRKSLESNLVKTRGISAVKVLLKEREEST